MSTLCEHSSNVSEMASDDAAGDPLDLLDRLDLGEEHGELVAGQPGEQRPRARIAGELGVDDDAKAVGDHDQQLVAAGMAEAVVDHLEAVEIDEQHRGVGPSAASLSSLSASERKCRRLGSEVTGSYMPSAWAFSIEARTSANSVSTAAASLGIGWRTDRRRRRNQVAVLDRQQPIAQRGERPGAFAVGPLRGDVADQQAERAGGQRGQDLLVELGEVEQRAQREDEGGEASGTRQDRVADLLGRACFHLALRPARRRCPPTHTRYRRRVKKASSPRPRRTM